MKVLLLHGWFSTGESKQSALEFMKHEVVKPSLNNIFFNLAVKTAQDAYDKSRPDVIVGSSRGGAVALNMDTGNTPLLLIAPAWKRFGKKPKNFAKEIYIMHSESDNMVPYQDSVELVNMSSNSYLFSVGSDHQLNCKDGFNTMKNILKYIENREREIKAS